LCIAQPIERTHGRRVGSTKQAEAYQLFHDMPHNYIDLERIILERSQMTLRVPMKICIQQGIILLGMIA